MVVMSEGTTGQGSAHVDARRAMAQERARVLRRGKSRDPRVARLEAASRAWQNVEEQERVQTQPNVEMRKHREGTSPVALLQIRPEEYAPKAGNGDDKQGVVDWIERKMTDWSEKNRGQEGPKRHPNGASIHALSRRMMATEWARALGRKPFDPRTIALEQEAQRQAKMQEEERQRAERERKMLARFCDILSREGIFTRSGTDKWELGGVEFAVIRAGEDWDVRIESPRPRLYMRRCGWDDLTRAYKARVDGDLNIIAYSRETAEAPTPREG